jgi:hypothetical protein
VAFADTTSMQQGSDPELFEKIIDFALNLMSA